MRWIWSFSIPAAVLLGYWLTHLDSENAAFWLRIGVIYAFVLHPIADTFLPLLKPGLPKPSRFGSFLADLLIRLTFPVQAFVLLAALLMTRELDPSRWNLWIALTISCGISAGALGITAAHELIHRGSRFDRGLGVGLLVMCWFGHYRVEHVFVHHKWVGTPLDTATAYEGESVYRFWWRSLTTGWFAAWRLERVRGWNNRVLQTLLMQVGLACAIAWEFGAAGLGVFFGQSVFAWLLLSTVNYIEHYGLFRREISPGKWEPFGAQHSWESRHLLTHASLFNLGLHTHHHLQAQLPYQELRPIEGTPQLPWGYSRSFLAALVPAIWFRK